MHDLVIRNGRIADGRGGPSYVADVGIDGEHIAAVGTEVGPGHREIDAEGRLVTPGWVDIHTHYDVEVLEGPGLAESLRHGITTLLLGSCSLSTVHVDPVDAGDLFGRVEAIPRQHVIGALQRIRDAGEGWDGAASYVEALERRLLRG